MKVSLDIATNDERCASLCEENLLRSVPHCRGRFLLPLLLRQCAVFLCIGRTPISTDGQDG